MGKGEQILGPDRHLRHQYIGTEHLLLGILRGESVAARALDGVALEATREAIVLVVGRDSDPAVDGRIPFAPQARDVLRHATDKAQELGHDEAGPHHLLLALADEGDGVAAQLLRTPD